VACGTLVRFENGCNPSVKDETSLLRRTARNLGFGRLLLKGIIQPLQRLDRYRLPDRACVLNVQGFDLEVISPRRNRIGEALYCHGVWEQAVTDAIKETAKAGMTVLDVGADIGYYTVLLARLAGSGPVFAFEPIPKARDILHRNIERNALKNVAVSPFALGSAAASAWLEQPFEKSRLNLNGAKTASGDVAVEIRRFDELAGTLGIQHVHFLKIDVEGAEHQVLMGMAHTIERDHPTCIIEVHGEMLPLFGSSKPGFLQWMRQHGYRWRWLEGATEAETGTSTFLFET
jgi:FkbM family methyltransferase